jgi:hypothetical protein
MILDDTNNPPAADEAGAERRASWPQLPLWGKIRKGTEVFGISRTEIYEVAKKHPDLLRKWGNATLLNFALMAEIIQALPVPKLRPIASIHDSPDVLARREASKAKFYAQRRSKRAKHRAGWEGA